MKQQAYKTAVVIGIQLIVALIHAFRVGTFLSGPWYRLYYSFFSDLILPFAFYFLLCMNEPQYSFLRPWWVKATLIFSLMTTSEICQYFGVYAFGVTFDPLDIVMYGLGVTAAVLVDTQLFSRLFRFWTFEYGHGSS